VHCCAFIEIKLEPTLLATQLHLSTKPFNAHVYVLLFKDLSDRHFSEYLKEIMKIRTMKRKA
jgi:hypothetical protein